jgi:uncharacterized membrane protein
MATYVEAGNRGGFPESVAERPSALERGQWERAASKINPERLARGLGWFSIGLGVAEVIAPRAIARVVGTRDHSGLIRGYGLREIAAGAGILTARKAAPWVWSRVAGDALDFAALGSALSDGRNKLGKSLFGIASVAGVTVLDVLCAQRLTERSGKWSGRAESSIIINRSLEETYNFWHNLDNLPRFMKHLQSVRSTGSHRSHWIARGLGDAMVEWDAEIVEDRPNRRIAWRSLTADVPNSGSVEFEPAPGNRGNIVRVQIDFGNPAHALAASAAALMGKHPGQIVSKDLRRFKQVLETGEIITTERQPAGCSSGTTWLDAIAR